MRYLYQKEKKLYQLSKISVLLWIYKTSILTVKKLIIRTHILGSYQIGSGPRCAKLTTSLVNVSLKFQTLISNICKYCLLKKK